MHKLNGMKATQVPLRERNSSDVKQYKLEGIIITLLRILFQHYSSQSLSLNCQI